MFVLVTGATGLVGSHLVRELLTRGDSVRVLHRKTSDLRLIEDLVDHIEMSSGDLTEYESVAAAVRGVDHVYHAGAYIGASSNKLRSINIEGTANVVNACLDEGIKRMVHTSSQAAMGRSDPNAIVDEQTEWVDSSVNTAYSLSKRAAELEVYRGIAEGLDAVIVNPSIIFGKGRPGENTMAIIDQVLNESILGVPVGGSNVVDVLDVVEGHLRAMEVGKTGERYFLGSENLSWKEIFSAIATAGGVPPPTRVVGPRLALFAARVAEIVKYLPGLNPQLTVEVARMTARRFRYSNRKARDELGMAFRPFSESMERIIEEIKT